MATEEQTSYNFTFAMLVTEMLRAGNRLTISNRTVTKLGFWLSKNGSPSGNLTFTVRRESNDAVLLSKVWGNATSLTTSPVYREATFVTPALVNELVYILCEWGGADPANYPKFHCQNSDIKASEYMVRKYPAEYLPEAAKDAAYIYTYQDPVVAAAGGGPANLVAAGII